MCILNVFDNVLMQKSGVIGIVLILIYSSYKKRMAWSKITGLGFIIYRSSITWTTLNSMKYSFLGLEHNVHSNEGGHNQYSVGLGVSTK